MTTNTRSRLAFVSGFLDEARKDLEHARQRVEGFEKEIQHLLVLERDEMAAQVSRKAGEP